MLHLLSHNENKTIMCIQIIPHLEEVFKFFQGVWKEEQQNTTLQPFQVLNLQFTVWIDLFYM